MSHAESQTIGENEQAVTTGEVPAVTSTLPSKKASSGQVCADQFDTPGCMFTSGNLTVDDAGNHRLVQLTPNWYYTKDNTLALGNAFILATGSVSLGTNSSFAVDTSEGLYISDESNNRIIHVDRFGKTSIVDFSSFSTALTNPNGVTLDPVGNLYVMDAGGASGAQRIVQEILGGTSSVVTTLPYVGTVTLGGSPNGLAVDNFANLLVADFGGAPGTGHLTQINVAQSSLSFSSTPQYTNSSAMTATVTNVGDQNLVFSAIPNTANFSVNASDENLCTSSTNLEPAMSCDVSVALARP